MITGIYILTNIINGKCYVGQSWDVGRRLKGHVYTAISNTKCNQLIDRSIRKHGWENFEVGIKVLFLTDGEQDKLNEHERMYIIQYNSLHPTGYNLTEGGSNGKMPPSVRQKISESRKKGYAEGRISREPWNRGIPLPDKQKKQISKTLIRGYASGAIISKSLGKPVPPERVARPAATLKAAYANGKVVSKRKGVKLTPMTRQRISNTVKQQLVAGERKPLPNHKGENWKINPDTGKRKWFKKDGVVV